MLIFHRYNYNTFWSSIMSTYMIFINEEWHLLVIDYWKLKGWYYIIFFVVILFVCQLFIMKMFTALLINHFCRSTNIKYLIKYSQDDQYFLPKFWKNKFKALYTTIKQFIFKILSCFYTIITKYFIKEKTEVSFNFIQ